MKFQFDAKQRFQFDAVAAVTGLFDGHPQGAPENAVIKMGEFGGLFAGQDRTEPAASSLSIAPVALGHDPGDSGHLPGNSGHMSGATNEELRAAAPAATRVAPAIQIRDVATLCRKRFLIPTQFGNRLDRSPEATNRPDQAYTTVEDLE